MKMYLTGGALRDRLLGIKSKDLDYAVEAPSFEAMVQFLEKELKQIYLITPEHLTVRGLSAAGPADFVLCRREGAYIDGRRPSEVFPGTLDDDLLRRDFTVNALAELPDGSIYDIVGGLKDLEARLLRFVGSAHERVTEDPVRLLRGIRFHITKGLKMHGDLQDMLQDSTWANSISKVAAERRSAELSRCFAYGTVETLQVLETIAPDNLKAFFEGILLQPTLKKKINL